MPIWRNIISFFFEETYCEYLLELPYHGISEFWM